MEEPRSDEGKLKVCRMEERIEKLRTVRKEPNWKNDDVFFGCDLVNKTSCE